jgi:glycosyltransferase involved in cell wall biosynthesis
LKAAFVLPCRNKEKYVGLGVQSVLAQTYSPMEFIFSDQGSTDNTYQEIVNACEDYSGPNHIRIVRCPDTEPVGMRGMNAHCNWLNKQTDADIILSASCDDLNHPQRAEFVIKAFEEHDPAMVLTANEFIDEDGNRNGFTAFPLESRFVTGKETIERAVGGSSSIAWSRAFYEKVGGVHNTTSQDVFLPYLASQDKGLYFLREALHAYVQRADPDNLGLEGVYRAAKTQEEMLQLLELMHYSSLSTYRMAAIKAEELYPKWSEPGNEDKNAILCVIAGRGAAWADVRDQMTLKRIQPKLLKS